MSRACRFLMLRVCFPNLVLREHCYSRVVILDRLDWKGVVMSCRASLEIVYRKTTETVEIQRGGQMDLPVQSCISIFFFILFVIMKLQ